MCTNLVQVACCHMKMLLCSLGAVLVVHGGFKVPQHNFLIVIIPCTLLLHAFQNSKKVIVLETLEHSTGFMGLLEQV